MSSTLARSLLVCVCSLAFACGDPPATGASADASGKAPASAKPAASTSAKPAPSATPAPSADTSASPATLPGTPLKDALPDVGIIMVLGKASGPMGVMTSEKKDITEILDAIGLDQKLDKGFGAKCITPTQIAFQSKDKKQLGMLGFCDNDEELKKGRFDSTSAQQAAVEIKDPAKLVAALKKLGALK